MEWWELRHLPSGVGVREQVTPGWSKLVLWGTERVVSAEAFVAIRLAPGESMEWRRDYTFFGG